MLSTIHIKTTGDRMSQRLSTRSVRALALAVLLTGGSAAVAAPAAHAGNWVHVTCANPDGSLAPTEGWTGFAQGLVVVGTTNTTCGQGLLMGAILPRSQVATANMSQVLQYTPPEGSTLAGGTAFVGLTADGYGDNTTALAAVLTPEFAPTPSNVLVVCAARSTPCQNNTNNYYGPVEIPPGRGGNLYLMAGCTGTTGAKCNSGGSHGAWAAATVAWANLALSTIGLPTASDFRGGLLDASAHGTAGLAFTANDPGPGVYKVIVTIDNKIIYDATPNTN
ncbi:MAG: hypothetical protein QOE31_427, partial [Solirubrobacteraceae bacterium]|nr:hypothetical protein [Solirubrobacteraceae bacterium]